jgi:DNA-binding transcriptional MerR regulator
VTEKIFSDTSGRVAREAALTVQTIIRYADLGFLDFVRSSDGTRLFAPGQAEKARRIYEERMARRGKRRSHGDMAA